MARMATVTCSHCKGKGVIPVTGVYKETLRGLRRLCEQSGGYCVANIHAAWFGCKGTALSNRLAWLEAHGLARSVKYGRQRRYVAKEINE